MCTPYSVYCIYIYIFITLKRFARQIYTYIIAWWSLRMNWEANIYVNTALKLATQFNFTYISFVICIAKYSHIYNKYIFETISLQLLSSLYAQSIDLSIFINTIFFYYKNESIKITWKYKILHPFSLGEIMTAHKHPYKCLYSYHIHLYAFSLT